MIQEDLYIVILAGGVGKRLWPMSSKEHPKQFQPLISDQSMLRETLNRVDFIDPAQIFISTNDDYVSLVHDHLPEVPAENIIGEPCSMGTGPCIALAAKMIQKKNPNAVMALLNSDHLIRDLNSFKAHLLAAAQNAHANRLLHLIGVKADWPNTNLGYIKMGEKEMQNNATSIHLFDGFKEKPDHETAKTFVENGNYLWNTAFFVWRVDQILELVEEHLPNTHQAVSAIANGSNINEEYPRCENIAIDTGVMEKVDTNLVRVIPAEFGWNDIGTWGSLHDELGGTDNLTKGNVDLHQSHRNLIYNFGDHRIVGFGIDNLIVVHHKGETLICPKEKSAELKKLLAYLDEKDQEQNTKDDSVYTK